MKNAVSALGSLHQNPYVLAPYLESFYRNVSDKDILLSYLVLPMLFDSMTLSKLKVIRSDSTVFTKFSDKNLLSGIELRVQEFKRTTNMCLQVLFELGVFEKGEARNILVSSESLIPKTANREKVKAAHQLAKLLDSYEVRECYRFLGVKSL